MTAVTRYAGSRIAEIQRSTDSGHSTVVESFLYAYAQSGENAARLESITVRRQADGGAWSPVAGVRYTYYQSGDSHGVLGDLQAAVRQVVSNGVLSDGDTSYYRYYQSGESGGFAHGLKYVVSPRAFALLAADPAVADPYTASDAQVAAYADHFFQYDAQCRVATEAVDGGTRSYGYSYQAGTSGGDANQWASRTTETRPDGSRQTVYTNFLGAVLLKELSAGDDQWVDFYSYDDQARLVMHATPAAVASYADNAGSGQALVVNLLPDQGLIELNQYYGVADTASGGYSAAGLIQYQMVQQGSSGTPVILKEYRYTQQAGSIVGGIGVIEPMVRPQRGPTEHAVGDDFIVYPLAAYIRYAADDGSHPITTSYTYTAWYPNSVQALERVTTLPMISANQNGPGTAATRTEQFTSCGAAQWIIDERASSPSMIMIR